MGGLQPSVAGLIGIVKEVGIGDCCIYFQSIRDKSFPSVRKTHHNTKIVVTDSPSFNALATAWAKFIGEITSSS
jgi:hypothetical protein